MRSGYLLVKQAYLVRRRLLKAQERLAEMMDAVAKGADPPNKHERGPYNDPARAYR